MISWNEEYDNKKGFVRIIFVHTVCDLISYIFMLMPVLLMFVMRPLIPISRLLCSATNVAGLAGLLLHERRWLVSTVWSLCHSPSAESFC